MEQVLRPPQHPYTWSLLKSVPRMDSDIGRLVAINGHPPDPTALPQGCKFQPRCPFAVRRCSRRRSRRSARSRRTVAPLLGADAQRRGAGGMSAKPELRNCSVGTASSVSANSAATLTMAAPSSTATGEGGLKTS